MQDTEWMSEHWSTCVRPSFRPRTAAARRHSTTRMLYCRGAASALAERVRELATTKVTPWGRGTSSVYRCCSRHTLFQGTLAHVSTALSCSKSALGIPNFEMMHGVWHCQRLHMVLPSSNTCKILAPVESVRIWHNAPALKAMCAASEEGLG